MTVGPATFFLFLFRKKNHFRFFYLCRKCSTDKYLAVCTATICCRGGPEAVSRLILTASGGPFRTWNREDLEHVPLEQALKHPTWSMGRKITIDSATLFNKGLEMIEARWLFDVPMEKVDVIVHPQSIVHSICLLYTSRCV